MQSKTKETAIDLPLHEIVVLAAYLAGADRGHVDTEDIAYKANEIAPGRFTWRKYKDQIKIDAIYKHLWDLTKPDKGEFITGSEKDGWLLTVAGTSFAERMIGKLKHLSPARERRPKKEEDWIRRERNRMLDEPAFLKLRTGNDADVTVADAERFFRIDDYVVGAARARKLQQAENAFHGDPVLGFVVSKLASIVRGRQ